LSIEKKLSYSALVIVLNFIKIEALLLLT